MFATLILGAGPGGTGPLIHAAQAGLLDAWLARGIAIVERNKHFGGTIGRYVVNSDSLGGVYLECLASSGLRDRAAALAREYNTNEIRRHASGFPPLPLVGAWFDSLGGLLEHWIATSETSVALTETEARSLRLRRNGTVELAAIREGQPLTLRARTAILALGGQPQTPPAQIVRIIARTDPSRVIQSDALLTAEGMSRAHAMLSGRKSPRVVILGGSHSAYSAAWLLLSMLSRIPFNEAAISILCRKEPRIYYPSRAEADAEAYAFAEEDVCPRTGRVNRMAGLRGDGRELWRAMNGRKHAAEKRVVSVPRLSDTSFVASEIGKADLVIPAFGYVARTLPIFGLDGERFTLRAEQGGVAVDDQARLVLADGTALPNIFGIGLGHGFHPSGVMGGEPSFRGQANSLWLYQNHIGARVLASVQTCIEKDAARANVRFGAAQELPITS